jgi:hypothetical protein
MKNPSSAQMRKLIIVRSQFRQHYNFKQLLFKLKECLGRWSGLKGKEHKKIISQLVSLTITTALYISLMKTFSNFFLKER